MNITVTFNSLKELQDFQNSIVIKGTADAQKPGEGYTEGRKARTGRSCEA